MRLAEGYLPGKYDFSGNTQIITGKNATIWAQLAIPGQGWRDLFPIANVQTIEVPGPDTTHPTPEPQPSPTTLPQPLQSQPPPSVTHPHDTTAATTLEMVLVVVGAFLGILLLVGLVLSRRWARFGDGLAPLPRIFVRIALLARLAGIRLQRSDTASQATAKVATYLPAHRDTLTTMNSSYEQWVYGRPERRNLLPQLNDYWQRLRGVLWQLTANRFWRRGKTPNA